MANITDAQIIALYAEREAQLGPVMARMRMVMNQSNGDIIVPLPDMDRADKPAVANLFKQALDQTAARVVSLMPMLECPALKPHIGKSQDLADQRRKAILGWWDANDLPRRMSRRARYFVGYGSSPVVISPDMKRGIPQWHVRNPLTTFAAPTDPDDMCPENVIFTYPKTLGWVQANYPQAFMQLYSTNAKASDRVDIMEYTDCDETVLLATTKSASQAYENWPMSAPNRSARLEQFTNLAKMPRVIVPGRVTLDRLTGQFDGMIPLFTARAKAMALNLLAVEKGIFPDLALVGYPNDSNTPTIVGGEWKDGRSGEVNVIQHGHVEPVALNPGFATTGLLDRLEQYERTEGSVPSEYGGESGTNIRTGRRGDAVMQAAVSFPIAEAQETFASSLEAENKVAIAVAKGWFGGTAKSFYVNWKGAKGQVEYTPNITFETDENIVTFPLAGLDAQNLAIAIQTRVGSGMMSKDRGRVLDPMVDDPRAEEEQINVENLQQAFMTWIDQGISQGTIAGDEIVRMIVLVQQGKGLDEAYTTAQAEAQARQASVPAPPAPSGPPQPGTAPPGSPPTMPGMNPASAGAQVPVSGPPQGLMNIANLLSTLHRTGSGAPSGPPGGGQ